MTPLAAWRVVRDIGEATKRANARGYWSAASDPEYQAATTVLAVTATLALGLLLVAAWWVTS